MLWLNNGGRLHYMNKVKLCGCGHGLHLWRCCVPNCDCLTEIDEYMRLNAELEIYNSTEK